ARIRPARERPAALPLALLRAQRVEEEEQPPGVRRTRQTRQVTAFDGDAGRAREVLGALAGAERQTLIQTGGDAPVLQQGGVEGARRGREVAGQPVCPPLAAQPCRLELRIAGGGGDRAALRERDRRLLARQRGQP